VAALAEAARVAVVDSAVAAVLPDLLREAAPRLLVAMALRALAAVDSVVAEDVAVAAVRQRRSFCIE
jgi:hypothetical protein